jgi:hypothetical protein
MYFNENFLQQNHATFGQHMYPRALNWYNYVGHTDDETTAGINAINQARLGYVYMLNDMINTAINEHNHQINNYQNIINQNNQNNQNQMNQNNQNNQNQMNQYINDDNEVIELTH